MISILGYGWVSPDGHGSARGGSGGAGEPDRNELFQQPFRNFGRLDRTSRQTCYAIGLALKDSGLTWSFEHLRGAGIIGAGAAGCLDSDAGYFRDYYQEGRTLGRGNLFIYTLPSSPLAEAAIHFGLTGPLFYLGAPRISVADSVMVAAEVMEDQEVPMMLAGCSENGSAMYVVLARDLTGDAGGLCPLEEVPSMFSPALTVSEMVARLASGGNPGGVGK